MAVINGEKAPTLSPNPKKAKLDRISVKQILDETVIEIVASNEYVEDGRPSIFKLLEGTIFLALAMFAGFFLEKFTLNLNRFLLFFAFSPRASRKLVGYFMKKNVFLFTYPGSPNSTGLAVSSKLSRSSDMYTLAIDSSNPKSSWARPPVKLTKSFTEWFDSDGVLMEELFQIDVVGLVNDYAKERNESKWDWFWRISISLLLELFLVFGLLGLGILFYY